MSPRQVKTRASKKAAPKVQEQKPLVQVSGESSFGAELLDGFIEDMRVERGASVHTLRSYKADIEAYLRWCERKGIDPREATHRQLRSYLGEMDAARYARSTINRHLSALHGFYGWMSMRGFVSSDPSVASVNRRTGKLTARRPGSATITATTASGVSARCDVTVTAGEEPGEAQ